MVLNQQTAAWLVDNLPLRAVFSARSRDADRATVEQIIALINLGSVGYAVGDVDVTKIDTGQSSPEESKSHGRLWITTSAAAEVAGVGLHAIRRACREKRLISELDSHGHYRVDQESAQDFRPRRRSA